MPRFYPILDAEVAGTRTLQIADALANAGIELLQFRDKSSSSRQLHATCADLVKILRPRARKKVRLIVNDRADIAAMCGADGVHLGQDDLSISDARTVLDHGSKRSHPWAGVSSHNLKQLKQAAASDADYIAIGPIFATSTKKNPDPVVGLDFIARARKLTKKPLVAIGGITLENAKSVWRAGADSVAIISDVIGARDPAARARQYLDLAAAFTHSG